VLGSALTDGCHPGLEALEQHPTVVAHDQGLEALFAKLRVGKRVGRVFDGHPNSNPCAGAGGADAVDGLNHIRMVDGTGQVHRGAQITRSDLDEVHARHGNDVLDMVDRLDVLDVDLSLIHI